MIKIKLNEVNFSGFSDYDLGEKWADINEIEMNELVENLRKTFDSVNIDVKKYGRETFPAIYTNARIEDKQYSLVVRFYDDVVLALFASKNKDGKIKVLFDEKFDDADAFMKSFEYKYMISGKYFNEA